MDSSLDVQLGQLPTFSLWRSDDAGATWTKGAAQPSQNVNMQMLATSNTATGKNALYFLIGVDNNTSRLYYSGDGGATWGASTSVPSPNDPNVLLASLPSGAILIGGGGDSGPGL